MDMNSSAREEPLLALSQLPCLTIPRPGAFVITTALPIICYAFGLLCNDITGCPATSLLHPSTLTLESLKQDVGWHGWSTIFTTQAFLANLGWYGLSLLLYRFLPAIEAEGTELRTGGRLNYRFNGTLLPRCNVRAVGGSTKAAIQI